MKIFWVLDCEVFGLWETLMKVFHILFFNNEKNCLWQPCSHLNKDKDELCLCVLICFQAKWASRSTLPVTAALRRRRPSPCRGFATTTTTRWRYEHAHSVYNLQFIIFYWCVWIRQSRDLPWTSLTWIRKTKVKQNLYYFIFPKLWFITVTSAHRHLFLLLLFLCTMWSRVFLSETRQL